MQEGGASLVPEIANELGARLDRPRVVDVRILDHEIEAGVADGLVEDRVARG